MNGSVAVIVMGLLQRIVPTALDKLGVDREWLYGRSTLGLTTLGAAVVFGLAAAATWFGLGSKLRDLFRPEAARDAPAEAGADGETHPLEGRLGSRRVASVVAWLVVAVLLLAMPYLVGPVVSRILGTVRIFLLLGLGLNIVVGYAGLLDLGYVAFFAVGAYVMAILTGGTARHVQGIPAAGVRREPVVLRGAARSWSRSRR